ncbi:Pol [Symbiodinium necroappetens]|uniref:Pol protein n=1 Tax=Symbiodinium necroappetens TaxID=1628268 RepID=A0A812UWE3_9DINO|nr:Pol [Symbiodinium necroappetens]
MRATHPGPAANFFVSTSNPSGLRSKEPFYSDWGFGVHCFSETQLSAVRLPSSRRQFQACAKAVNRQARVTSGAPAALRVNSDWAGTWTGVLQVGDLPCSTFNVAWPPGLFETGRVMISRHFHESLSVMIATVYGYPQGPTWPDALSRTDTLLGTLTREVVLGSKGFRVICGDFNHDTGSLHQCQIWKSHGWIEAQDLAFQCWGIIPQPTCKNATQRDFIWLSPEAASYCVQVQLFEVFQEHSTLIAGFALPCHAVVEQSWPLPAELPWADIDVGAWHQLVGFQPVLASSPSVPPVPLALCGPVVLVRIFYVTMASAPKCELRDPAPEQVDTLQVTRDYAILATDVPSAQLHVERPLDLRGHSTWAVDGVSVSIHSAEADTCTLACAVAESGQELEQVQVLSSVPDLHDEFISLWAPRWQQHANASPSDWQRFLDFAAAYLPRHSFELPDIDVSTWTKALRRFRPRAARGPDGWARDDLLSLPPARTAELLSFLRSLELDGRPWPKQLVIGFVCLLNKGNGRLDANGFRPICLFSIIYRTWAGIRARQVLAALRSIVPDGLFGFVPGREATELWYSVQLEVELSILGGTRLLGLSTDVVKAFNCLPRAPLLSLAAQLGCPRRLLGPWSSFLEVTERRFMIRQQVSKAVLSTSGFPEGCPLSPVAMVFADWAYHVYIQAFAPAVRAFSFVDNFACTAFSAAALLHAYNLVRCFMDLLRLQLDAAQTFAWATVAADRGVLATAGFKVLQTARELGGVMSFGPSVRNSALRERCKLLNPLWKKLQRSRAPCSLKLSVLPKKLWAKALHGISGTPLAESVVHSLRTSATSSLRIRPGGSSSLLRLSTAPLMTADPGFYQLLCCVLDARRMAHKVPNFLSLWRHFSSLRDGRQLHGPLSKLTSVLAQVGWAVQLPPWVMDHHGIVHNLLDLPGPLLRRLLEQAWLGFVACQHSHRKTMSNLCGIDLALLRATQLALGALDAARLAAIQSGAFWCGQQQARFDMGQTGLCPLCQVEDSVEHRLRHCPRYAAARVEHAWVLDMWDELPVSVTHHLLPPANPHLPALHRLLQDGLDTTGQFFCKGSGSGWQCLFTDGSCHTSRSADLALAGWGVILANTGQAVACGTVPGLLQTAPRAEILALTAAARWALATGLPCLVWTDAANVCAGVAMILDSGCVPGTADNDLWSRLAGFLKQLNPRRFLVRHTPSHLDTGLTESPTEDWLAIHNNHADVLAGIANSNRPQTFLEVHGRAVRYHDTTLRALVALRAIFFGIADLQQNGDIGSATPEGEDEEPWILPSGAVPRRIDLEDTLPVNWRQTAAASASDLPCSFILQLCEFVWQLDAEAEHAYKLSWLELVFVLHCSNRYLYPACNHMGQWVEASTLVFPPPAHTVAARLTLVRRALRPALRSLGFDCLFIQGVDLSDLGVRFSLDGIVIGVDTSLLLRARTSLGRFVQGRAGTRSTLARPL